MGLDMYFEANKRHYISYGAWDKEEGKPDNTNYPEALKALADYIEERNFKSTTIKESYQIGYFRKFNALHNYIVVNYADGEDDCREIYLGKSDIEELKAVCDEVLQDRNKAPELLPTQEGFFFGSTVYDDWYFQDVANASELFSLILESIDFNDWDISYQASW